MGVALSSCEVPGSGGPTFELPADAIEIGMGVHGEPGIRRGPLQSADAIARGPWWRRSSAEVDEPSGGRSRSS